VILNEMMRGRENEKTTITILWAFKALDIVLVVFTYFLEYTE